MRPWVYAAGLAIAGCSTSQRVAPSGPDTGVAFTELNEAAKAACQWIWDHEPKAQIWEYCGTLYEGEGGIRVGLPITQNGGKCGTAYGPPLPPDGAKLLGRYHSHRFTAEPSIRDLTIAERYPTIGHFLCAPSRIVRRFGTKEGTVIVP
ncbi:MAG TPA: hypothetical protein VIG99_01005 [Myxococcaceae bacterium]